MRSLSWSIASSCRLRASSSRIEAAGAAGAASTEEVDAAEAGGGCSPAEACACRSCAFCERRKRSVNS